MHVLQCKKNIRNFTLGGLKQIFTLFYTWSNSRIILKKGIFICEHITSTAIKKMIKLELTSEVKSWWHMNCLVFIFVF